MFALWRARRGSVSVLTAISLTALVGFAALAVDVGWLHLQQRRLQGIADRAALAAADGGAAGASARVARLIAIEGGEGITVHAVLAGGYTPDHALSAPARFRTGGAGIPAAQVLLVQRTSLFLGAALIGRGYTDLSARATAARSALAAFSIGSRLARVEGGLPGALLNALAGTDLDISVADYRALLAADVDLLRLSNALGTRAGVRVGTFDELVAMQWTLPQLLGAMADASDGSAASAVLNRIAARVPATTVDLAKLIDLGPLAAADRTGTLDAVRVGADGLLREALIVAGGERQVQLDLGASVPGLGGVRIAAVIGDRERSSPWVRVASDNSVEVTTSQIRLRLDTRLALPLGLVAANVPIIVEGAPARARLAGVTCTEGGPAVDMEATVAPARAMIGEVGDAAFRDLGRPLSPTRAELVRVPLLTLTGRADTTLAASDWQRLHFTADDIAQKRAGSVNAAGITGGTVGSLLGNLDIQGTGLGALLNLGPASAALRAALSLATPALDLLLEQAQELLGVRIGQADVRVHAARCGRPVLVI